ncbi:MAG: chaperone NapD [Calditrichaeota bacterium]|nr:chaperone NapD [Calditrichota bacterium]
MPIAGVVVVTVPERTSSVLQELKKLSNVTTYGVHKENNIIAVLESDTTKGLEQLSNQISQAIQGVIGVFPAYINFEDEISDSGTDTSTN